MKSHGFYIVPSLFYLRFRQDYLFFSKKKSIIKMDFKDSNYKVMQLEFSTSNLPESDQGF